MNTKTTAVAKADTKTPAKADTTATDGKAPEGTTQTAEQPQPDPFADLPVVTLGEAEGVRDMTGLETSAARKYSKVHAEATEGKLPVQKGWKHTTAMFIPGHNKGGENGFKAGSVYGTIQQIAQAAGKAGIPAYELAAELRRRMMGNNKRSHFCEKLPPVGWAEGWINSAVTKNILGVHATKKAPALVVPEAPAGTESTPAQDEAAKKQIAKAA